MLQKFFSRLRRWRISRHAIPDRNWSTALRSIPYIGYLDQSRLPRLRELATLFLADKHFSTAHDFELTTSMRVRIAIKACIPVLELGLDYYDNFRGIVVYPGDFRVNEQHMDDAGVLHDGAEELCGQSLDHGPMILSWSRIASEQTSAGQDLVIHECAHKLDILNGNADGYPPLPADLPPKIWARVFRDAYENFCDDIDAGRRVRLDPYAAQDAAEFFAVASETFFTRPDILFDDFSGVYWQLASFYRQDPHSRMNP